MNYQSIDSIETVFRRRVVRSVAALFAICALGLMATPTQAQSEYPPGKPAREDGPRYFHASTVAQGRLDGWASVIRSIGQLRYNTALAARHAEAAQEQAIKNRMQRIETYYQAKDYRRNYLDEHAPPKMTMDRVDRIRQARLPDRLTARQYDQFSGRIIWPDALLDARFAQHRNQLEKMFDQRTASQLGKGSRNLATVERTIKDMRQMLGEDVRADAIAAQEFGAANRFLSGLRIEGHFPSQGIALSQK